MLLQPLGNASLVPAPTHRGWMSLIPTFGNISSACSTRTNIVSFDFSLDTMPYCYTRSWGLVYPDLSGCSISLGRVGMSTNQLGISFGSRTFCNYNPGSVIAPINMCVVDTGTYCSKPVRGFFVSRYYLVFNWTTNCILGNWSAWSSCSAPCGDGINSESLIVIFPRQFIYIFAC